MKDTMYEQEGVGIAGVQVGVLRRVFIIELDDEIIEFVNPVISERKGEQIGSEGCLSVLGESGFVQRPEFVRIEAYDRNGEKFILEVEGFGAVVICHEYDHLEGKLFIDNVLTEEQLTEMGYELETEEGEE